MYRSIGGGRLNRLLQPRLLKASFSVRMTQESTVLPITDVALVWKLVEEKKFDVCLEKFPTVSSCIDKEDLSDRDALDAALLYERQRRKAQHAKKAGRKLNLQDLDVIYVDDDIVVVNKPAGVLSVPGVNGNSSMLDLVYEKYGAPKITGDPAVMIVHRLDMDTSGLLVFSRSPEITKKLHADFRDKKVVKYYEALVMGTFPPVNCKDFNTSLRIDLPLQKDHLHPPFMRVSTPESERGAIAAIAGLQKRGWKKLIRKKPKPSETSIHIVEHGTRPSVRNHLPFTRLRLEPITGRTHQLRVHCAALGFAIVGDPTYSLNGEAAPSGGLKEVPSFSIDGGISIPDALKAECTRPAYQCSIDVQKAWNVEHPPNVRNMCLHATYLELRHPTSNKLMHWNSSPDF